MRHRWMIGKRCLQHRQKAIDLGSVAARGFFDDFLRQIITQDIFWIDGLHGLATFGVICRVVGQASPIRCQPMVKAFAVDEFIPQSNRMLVERYFAQCAEKMV